MRESEYKYECTVLRCLNLRRGKPTLFVPVAGSAKKSSADEI